jgi:hypothetical protein
MKKKISRNLACAFLAMSLIFIEGCDKKDKSLHINNKNQQQIEEVKNEGNAESHPVLLHFFIPPPQNRRLPQKIIP